MWRRIDARRNSQPWLALARGHPAILATLIVVATAAGGWGGAEFARARVETQTAAMADSYVQALDARQMNMP